MHRADDDVAFFAADIGHTWEVALTTASAGIDEKLLPGRYLIQLVDLADLCWVHFGKWDDSVGVITATLGEGPQRIPVEPNSFSYFETNIKTGYSDSIAAIMRSGTATMYVTRISRRA